MVLSSRRQWIVLFALAVVPALLLGLGPWLQAKRDPDAGDLVKRERARLEATLTPAERARLNNACQLDDCACVGEICQQLLAANQAGLALTLLRESAQPCPGKSALGLRAEAMARLGKHDQARVAAGDALEAGAGQRNAWYARALLAYELGEDREALAAVDQAIIAGRGVPALQLRGLIYYRQENFPMAQRAFERALGLDADQIDTLYNLALTSQRLDRYRSAREGYLAVLERAPQHADARYNLAVLTYGEGVTQEAAHHLRQLRRVVSNKDERVAKLETLLRTGPAP